MFKVKVTATVQIVIECLPFLPLTSLQPNLVCLCTIHNKGGGGGGGARRKENKVEKEQQHLGGGGGDKVKLPNAKLYRS